MKRLSLKLGFNTQQKITIRDLNGLVHALIASFLSIAAFLSEPRLELDLIHSSNSWVENCVNISTGFFLADTLILIYQWLRIGRNKKNIFIASRSFTKLHHLAAFGVFYYALCSDLFMGYSTMCQLLEVSSIFLKVRKIWKINQLPGIGDIRYHILAFVNFSFFIVFRLFVILYAISWWSKNIFRLPFMSSMLPLYGSILLGLINLRYLCLLLENDIIPIIKR